MELLDYFKVTFGSKSLGDITWSHAVNSQEKLDRFLNNPDINFIESDIRISPKGIAVCAHPPDIDSNLTLENLITNAENSAQGLKVDLKDPEILISCLQYLAKANLKQPIIINADVLQGNGANISKFSPHEFIALCKKYYPKGILSIGWTTVADSNYPYRLEDVEKMLELSEGLNEITYPVRACLLPTSWKNLEKLLEKPGNSLTIWNNEPVDKDLQKWIRENTDPQKTFYDFIDENKNPLRFW